MGRENVETAERALGALNQGGVDALLPYLDSEIEWISVPGFLPDSEDQAGHAGVRRWFDKLGDVFSDLQWELGETIDAGDRVVASATVTAMGKSSGIEVVLTLFHVITIRDGKAIRLESYLNRHEALDAAGLEE